MLVLTFDTTSEAGGVAAFRDGDCLGLIANDGPANLYSVTLFRMVDRLFSQTKISLREIDLFAVANGPGSFTGIRVGLAAAQAWARAFGRPVRGISVLEAMVEAARPKTEWAVPLLDARRAEFFLGVFRQTMANACASFEVAGDGMVLKPGLLATFLRERWGASETVTCVVREHDQVARALAPSLPDSITWRTVSGTLLEAMARLALRAHQQGKLQSPGELDAYYIRPPDAELLVQKVLKQNQASPSRTQLRNL